LAGVQEAGIRRDAHFYFPAFQRRHFTKSIPFSRSHAAEEFMLGFAAA
jgi:hypothetical protein